MRLKSLETKREKLFNNSTNPNFGEFTITEIDKMNFYNDILKEDEIAPIDYDNNFIYFFDENLPLVISKLFKMEIYEPKKSELTEEEILKILSKRKFFRKVLVNGEYVTTIDIYWPKFRDILDESCNEKILVSTYPIKRKIPFAFLNSDKIVEIDLLPLVESYEKRIEKSELLKRIKKAYRKVWEEYFGKWNENKKLSYIT